MLLLNILCLILFDSSWIERIGRPKLGCIDIDLQCACAEALYRKKVWWRSIMVENGAVYVTIIGMTLTPRSSAVRSASVVGGPWSATTSSKSRAGCGWMKSTVPEMRSHWMLVQPMTGENTTVVIMKLLACCVQIMFREINSIMDW